MKNQINEVPVVENCHSFSDTLQSLRTSLDLLMDFHHGANGDWNNSMQDDILQKPTVLTSQKFIANK